MDLEQTIAKYTGRHVTREQLDRAMQLDGLAAELAMGIGSTADAVGVTENELIRVIDTITRHTTTARQAITAEPGPPTPPLSRLDELHGAGVRFDALIAVRSQQLAHLDRLLRAWHFWLDPDAAEPGPPR
ncbi:hypothetical protein [Actinoplanes sp. NPDC026623]|uniref:hypothetical protein n=1 Tax=Actinoplanes sp. NPDC026623 TaxID=3155610 RepID=UPI0033C13CC5